MSGDRLASVLHPGRRRAADMAAFAKQVGLQFSAQDHMGLVDPALQIFRLGPLPTCANVMWGTWRGLSVVGCDLRYGREHVPDYWFSIGLVELDPSMSLPALMIERGNPPGRDFASRPIQFESEEFNRALHVWCKDREFAFRLIDPPMMEWLASTDSRFGFQVGGRKLLVHSHRLPAEGLLPLIATAKAFHDHVPRLVWDEHGTQAPDASAG